MDPIEDLTEETTLVIDDLRVFRFSCTYARTSQEAIDQLYNHGPWRYVFWDHDLGGDDTAVKILNWVNMESDAEALTTWFGDQIQNAHHYVHTSNPVGADRIVDELRGWNCATVKRIDPKPMLTGWLPT